MPLELPARLRPPAPPNEEDFGSPLHDDRVVARVGLGLGIALTVCFVTGLVSHYQQYPVPWLPLGPSPAWGYRVTQGVHVGAGTAMLPLLLVKLYTAYPRLFTSPPVRGLVHGLERLSIAVLVAATAFQVVTGLMNVSQWYPWGFGFTRSHGAVAWLAFGGLAVHVAVKLHAIRRAFAEPLEDGESSPGRFGSDPDGRTRRGLLVAVATVTGATALLSAGQTVYPLRRLALLAPRRPDVGPQGLPVNRSAAAAGVTASAVDPAWVLELVGPAGTRSLSRTELAGLPSNSAELAIACVEGWSARGAWSGVRMRDLVRLAGGDARSAVHVESLERRGGYRTSTLPAAYADDPRTLLALGLNGEALHLEHGYPARIIAPNRPGVRQTKWVRRLVVS